MELKNDKKYTLLELSSIYDISKTLLKVRARNARLKKTKVGGHQVYLLSQKQAKKITFDSVQRPKEIPDVIYVTRTIQTFESKSNFWSEKTIMQEMKNFKIPCNDQKMNFI